MIALPRRFEFESKPYGRGHLYDVDLDYITPGGYVGLWHSANHVHCDPNAPELFDGYSEDRIARLIESGSWRITIDKTEAATNIADLI